MTYNRDLQEDKERLFDTADTVRACVRLMAAMLANTAVNAAACAAAARDPLLLATDLADYLVKKGMPFRQAHHVVGAVVALAEKSGTPLDRFTLADFQGVDQTFTRDVTEVLHLESDGPPRPHRRARHEGSGEATGALAEAARLNART